MTDLLLAGGRALPKTTGTIGIEQFVKRADIPLSYYEKPYYVSPAAKGGKPYALLREVLKPTERVGLGKIVLSNKQPLAIIAPQDNALVLLLRRRASLGTSGCGFAFRSCGRATFLEGPGGSGGREPRRRLRAAGITSNRGATDGLTPRSQCASS